MADRTWITVSFPTPVIFRYHLPLRLLAPVPFYSGFGSWCVTPSHWFKNAQNRCHKKISFLQLAAWTEVSKNLKRSNTQIKWYLAHFVNKKMRQSAPENADTDPNLVWKWPTRKWQNIYVSIVSDPYSFDTDRSGSWSSILGWIPIGIHGFDGQKL